jgi:UDP:flavonoid glycosyltransferase YjiC (YdhE family)
VPDPSLTAAEKLEATVSILRRRFIDCIPGQVADYQSILVDFAADILLVDFWCYGAGALHDLGGPVWASLGINFLLTLSPESPPLGSGAQPAKTFIGRTLNRVQNTMADFFFFSTVTPSLNIEREKLGLPPLPSNGFHDSAVSKYLHIIPTTTAFEFPGKFPPNIHFVGPLHSIPLKAFEPPEWWDEITINKGEKKVVHVTQGLHPTLGVGKLVLPTIRALAEMPNIILVATTPDPKSTLINLNIPENARVAPFIRHVELLKHVDLMITHGSVDGVLAALDFGVPLVCAGRSKTQGEVISKVVWTGAGIDLGTDSPSEAMIRDAVTKGLQERKYKECALRVKADFEKHRSAAEACDLLEQLGRSKEVELRVSSQGYPEEKKV